MESKEKKVIGFDNIKFYSTNMVKKAIEEYTDFKTRKCRLPKFKESEKKIYNLYDLICDKKTNYYAQTALIKVGKTIRDVLTFLNIDCDEIIVNSDFCTNIIGLYNFEDGRTIKILRERLNKDELHVSLKSKDEERDEYYTIFDNKYYHSNDKISLKFRNGITETKESLENGYKYELRDYGGGYDYTHTLENEKYWLSFQADSKVLKDNKALSSTIKNLTLPTNVEELFKTIIDKCIIKNSNPYHMYLAQGLHTQPNKEEWSDFILINDGLIQTYKTTNNNATLCIKPYCGDCRYWTYDKEEDSYKYHVESSKTSMLNRQGENPTIFVSAENGDFKSIPTNEEIYTEANNAYQKTLKLIPETMRIKG